MKDRWYHPEGNLAKRGLDPELVNEAFLDGFSRRRRDGDNYEILGVTEDGEHLQIVFEDLPNNYRVFHARPMTGEEKRRYRRGGK